MLAAAVIAATGCGLIVGIEDYERLPPALDNLEVSTGVLKPPFSPDTMDYTLDLPLSAAILSVKPTPNDAAAVTVAVNDVDVENATFSGPIALSLGPNLFVVAASANGETRTYRLSITRGAGLSQAVFAKARNTGRDDYFGTAVALSGDTMVVGARAEDSAGHESNEGAENSGAVYVFRRSGDSWSQEAYLKAPNVNLGDAWLIRHSGGSAIGTIRHSGTAPRCGSS